MKNNMIKLLILVCFTSLTNILIGQNIKRYEGVMNLPSDLNQFKGILHQKYDKDYRIGAGTGYYDYYEDSDGSRIKHGKFLFESGGNYGTHGPNVISGTYSHGKKVGQWTFEPPKDKDQGYFKYLYSSLKITFKDDTFNGPCEFYTDKDHLQINMSCNFNNGILTGEASVILKFESSPVTNECHGIINEEGLLHGIWNLSSKGGIERTQKRVYYKGALVYAEEFDLSTGEKKICYTAFDNLNKLPDLDKIKDTIVNGQCGIVYCEQFAIKTTNKTYTRFKSKIDCSPYIIWYFPQSMTQSEPLMSQCNNWEKAVYSQHEYAEKLAFIENKRQEHIADSINKALVRAERERSESRVRLNNYIIDFKENHVLVSGNEFRTITPCNTDGKIKKCSYTNGETTFIIGKETVKGKFSKDFVKTDAGETFNPFPENLSSTEDGKMLIYKHQDSRSYGKCAFLIIKEGPLKGVYELSSSAQKCLQ